MISQPLLIFIIVLLGLVLFSFLGNYNCSMIEGNENMNGDSSDKWSAGSITQTTYYGPKGTHAVVTKLRGKYKIEVITRKGKSTVYYYIPPTNSDDNEDNEDDAIKNATFTGPYGGTARVITGKNGKALIEVTYPNGKKRIYASTTDEQYSNYSGDGGYYDDNYDMDDSDDDMDDDDEEDNHESSTYTTYDGHGHGVHGGVMTGPGGNSVGYATGPRGNRVISSTHNNPDNDPELYYDSLPQGVTTNMIPPGDEDLYILKSQVVPPVCPACPSSSSCPRTELPPPCPPCGRCPEPSFECKKIPNYNAIDNNQLPMPVLNDFTTFGM